MSVRDMKGDPGIWERLSWADMSSSEQELWTDLGWTEAMWDRNAAPESTNTEWRFLSSKQKSAAAGLGFTEDIWNNFEDQ